ncbi:hypothetical protein ES288_A10G000600v1 [Gossypium darwinii]|uniref:HIT domain-containing protein n=1 Tax=Gossypium darwinii TaxID=34276 RepID=A0A5D2EW07_GOSDA|nr:hypothetical protein ES288_A10G000600v1 [Gossypium darwinii]
MFLIMHKTSGILLLHCLEKLLLRLKKILVFSQSQSTLSQLISSAVKRCPKIFADYQLFSRGLLQSFEFQYQIRAPVVAWRSFKTFSATEKVLEWKSGVLAFRDIAPQAPMHILIIPKSKDGLTGLSKDFGIPFFIGL